MAGAPMVDPILWNLRRAQEHVRAACGLVGDSHPELGSLLLVVIEFAVEFLGAAIEGREGELQNSDGRKSAGGIEE